MNQVNTDVWVLTKTHIDFSPGPSFRLLTHSNNASARNAKHGKRWFAVWSRLDGNCIQITADRERAAAAKIGDCVVTGTALPWLSDRREPTVTGEALFLRKWVSKQTTGNDCKRKAHSVLLVTSTKTYYPIACGSKNRRVALRDTLLSYSLDYLTGGEHDPLMDESGRANIDHICVHKMLTLQSSPSPACPPAGQLEGLTDHYCIYADFEQI